MAALTGADVVKHKEEARLVSLPVTASEVIYQGGLCMLTALGYVAAATPTTATTFAGIASETVDNSSGASGAKYVLMFISGLHQMPIAGITVADVFDDVYAETDNVADSTLTAGATTDAQKAGKVVSLDEGTTNAWVDISVGINQQALGA